MGTLLVYFLYIQSVLLVFVKRIFFLGCTDLLHFLAVEIKEKHEDTKPIGKLSFHTMKVKKKKRYRLKNTYLARFINRSVLSSSLI